MHAILGKPSTFSRLQVVAISFVSALSWMSQSAVPYEVGVLTDRYRISLPAAGWLASAELAAVAIAASWLGRTIERRDKRRLTIGGLSLAVAMSVVSLFPLSLGLFVLVRMLFGGGMGIVAAAVNALPAGSSEPERIFGFMQMGLGILFSLQMLMTPLAASYFGFSALFAVELLFLLTIGCLAIALPRGADGCREAAPVLERLPAGAGRGLIGLTLMIIGQAACWAFAAQAAAAVHISGSALGIALGASAALALVGAAAATVLGLKRGLKRPLYVGYGGLIVVALGMYGPASRISYIVGVLLLNAFACFTIPYIQGVLSEVDAGGRTTALSGAAFNFGAAVAPALSAGLSVFPNLAPIGGVAALFYAVSAVTVLSSVEKLSRSGEGV